MAIGQDAIIDKVKASGLRGRGGAGFPTGMKWGFMPKEPKPGKPNFLVINADESEPGSCKDREIIRHDPHKLIEGALIAGFAMRARAAYIYIRGEFIRETEVLRRAVAEAYEAGLLGKNAVRHAATTSTCSSTAAPAPTSAAKKRRCSKASRASRASRASSRRSRPARASTAARPRSTMSRASRSCRRSCAAAPEWFASIGNPKNEGTKLFQLSGHVNTPCVVEESMGDQLPRADRAAMAAASAAARMRRFQQLAGGHSRRIVGAAGAGRGDPRRADGLRRAEGARLGPRHRGGDRHGQVDRHRPRDQPHQLFLQARELRPVHAVPRGHRLDVADDGAAARGRRRGRTTSTSCSTSPSRSKATPSARSATPPPGRSRAWSATSAPSSSAASPSAPARHAGGGGMSTTHDQLIIVIGGRGRADRRRCARRAGGADRASVTQIDRTRRKEKDGDDA